jgi:hypothetical protein
VSYYGRAVFAFVAALLTTGLMLAVFGLFGAGLSWGAVNYLFPTVSGVTSNTNTDWWGGWLLLPFAIAGGLVCGALVLDPKMSPKTEALTAVAVFVLLAGVSGVNFWTGDALINVNGQMLIDIMLSIASLVVIGLLTRWKPSLMTATAAQRVALFLVTVFGFVLPLYYATSLLLVRLGYREGLGDLSAFMKFVVSALGLAAAVMPSLVVRKGQHR